MVVTRGTMIKQIAVTFSLITLGFVQSASADIYGTVTFTDPVVYASNTATIPIYLTLTLDPASDALMTDASGNITDLSAGQVAANLFGNYTDSNNNPIQISPDPYTDPLSSNTNEFLGCSGTFFNSANACGGGTGPNAAPYSFNFNYGPAPEFAFATNLDLAPGSSTTYLFGSLTPTTGSVASGTYNLPSAGFFMQVFDDAYIDSNNNPAHIADIYFATDETAGFTAIVATPEPGFYGLLGLGLGFLAVCARRVTAHKN